MLSAAFITHQAHSSEFRNRLINTPSILCHLFVVVEGEKLLAVSEWKSKVLKFTEDRATRMIFLFVSEPKISHVLAQNVNAVGIFASRTGAANFFNSRDNTQGNV